MKHVFIAPRASSIYIQYLEFAKDQDSELIMIENSFRKIAKGLTLTNVTSSKIFDRLYDRYFEKTINEIVSKKEWEETICFVLYGRIYESYGESVIYYLRRKYQNSKIVVYFGDLISRHKIDIEKAKVILDGVFTFDIKDAEDYKLNWCLEPFSSDILRHKNFKNSSIKWDVTFVGAAKMRYKKILQMYEVLCGAGLKCDFHITGVKRKDRAYVGEIGYEPLDFQELLQHVNDSYCVAEVLQDGGVSPTTRYSEAMLFEKNLLTDCLYFADERNRNSNIFYFNTADDLKRMNLLELRNMHDNERRKYIKLLSVKNMCKKIDRSIEGVNDDSGIKTKI